MEECIQILHTGNYASVIENGGIRIFCRPGVADLYQLLQENQHFLQGATLTGKVVGKAAAGLMILGKVKTVYTGIISLCALILLRENNIQTDFARVVPYIRNRDNTDWCPLESLCYNETDPENIRLITETFIKKEDE